MTIYELKIIKGSSYIDEILKENEVFKEDEELTEWIFNYYNYHLVVNYDCKIGICKGNFHNVIFYINSINKIKKYSPSEDESIKRIALLVENNKKLIHIEIEPLPTHTETIYKLLYKLKNIKDEEKKKEYIKKFIYKESVEYYRRIIEGNVNIFQKIFNEIIAYSVTGIVLIIGIVILICIIWYFIIYLSF